MFKQKKFTLKAIFGQTKGITKLTLFCYNIRDGIANLIDGQSKVLKQNLCKQEFNKLQKIVVNKNEVFVINDTDKNLGAAIADKEDVVIECKRQLFDIKTY